MTLSSMKEKPARKIDTRQSHSYTQNMIDDKKMNSLFE